MGVNSHLKMVVELKPVESFDYKSCVSEIDFFTVNLIRHADISLFVRLIRELLQKLQKLQKLPAMFSSDINKLITEFEEEHKKVYLKRKQKNCRVDPHDTPIGLRE